jgi:hypothetical protein
MSPETARIIFFSIAAVMWVVWLVGTRFALSRVSGPPVEGKGPCSGDAATPGRQDLDMSPDIVTGEVVIDAVIEGGVEAVSKKIAEQLVSAAGAGGGSTIRITERTPERVVFERVPGASGGVAAQAMDSGIVRLDVEGDRIRIRYAVSLKRFMRVMRIAAYAVCFGYGALWVVGGPLLVWWLLFVREASPADRWQVFQTFQMVHGVWPPFLVGALAGGARRTAAGFLDALLANVVHIV